MRFPLLRRCVVLGAAGGFGRVFTALLGQAGEVVGVDLPGVPEPPGPHRRWLATDAAGADPRLSALLAEADLVVACLPEPALFAALGPVTRALPAGALVVDLTSVKSGYAEVVGALRVDLEFCSLEPLFAPDLGVAGRQVLWVELRGGPRGAALHALLAGAGAELVPTDADRADRQAAATQVAAHAALLAYGSTLASLGFDPDGPTTALQRALCTLLARVATRDAGVYWHIQRDNPYAGRARAALRSAVDALDAAVSAGDDAAFARIVRGGAEALGDHLEAQAARSARVLDAAAGRSVPHAGNVEVTIP